MGEREFLWERIFVGEKYWAMRKRRFLFTIDLFGESASHLSKHLRIKTSSDNIWNGYYYGNL